MLRSRCAVALLVLAGCAPSSAWASNKYALVIGIDGSAGTGSNDESIRYADRDATEFADFIKRPEGAGVPSQNVRLRRNAEAKRADIFRELNWLKDVVRTDDDVYVFFSGHGIKGSDGDVYFLPYDARPDDPVAIGIRAEDFVKTIRRAERGHVYLFIDACYAAAGISQRGHEETKAAATQIQMAFVSSDVDQRSREDSMLEHGIFSWYLIRGLEGAADRLGIGNGDGWVTAVELDAYLREEVPKRWRALYDETAQTPLSVYRDGSVPLSHPGAGSATGSLQGSQRAALDAFQRAYQAGDIDGLLDVFPGFQSVAKLRDDFRDLKEVSVVLDGCTFPVIVQDNVTVVCDKYSLAYMTLKGLHGRTPLRSAEFVLHFDDPQWVITSMHTR